MEQLHSMAENVLCNYLRYSRPGLAFLIKDLLQVNKDVINNLYLRHLEGLTFTLAQNIQR